MSLWIDLDNSPHVHFFAPLIRRLERERVAYLVTVRSFSQTQDLATSYGLKFVTIGGHGTPHYFVTRAAETAHRALQLASYVGKQGVTAAVSHGSRALLLASCVLSVPAMTLYDYEFASNRFAHVISRKILVPSVIPVDRLKAQGLRMEKLIQYPGLKEEMYVYDFRPDAQIISSLDLDPTRLIITLRPPHTSAHYQSPKTEILLQALIRRLRQECEAQVLVLCRTEQQAQALKENYGLGSLPFRVVTEAVDGLSLMWFSDAIFSGGGTMVREAALLGLNAYSIFAGKFGAADAELERRGQLRMIRSIEEVERLSLTKASPHPYVRPCGDTQDSVCQEVLRFARANETAATQKGRLRKKPADFVEL